MGVDKEPLIQKVYNQIKGVYGKDPKDRIKENECVFRVEMIDSENMRSFLENETVIDFVSEETINAISCPDVAIMKGLPYDEIQNEGHKDFSRDILHAYSSIEAIFKDFSRDLIELFLSEKIIVIKEYLISTVMYSFDGNQVAFDINDVQLESVVDIKNL